MLRFRCYTGHAYTANTLLAEVSEPIESKLWQSMPGPEEMNMLLKSIGDQQGQEGSKLLHIGTQYFQGFGELVFHSFGRNL